MADLAKMRRRWREAVAKGPYYPPIALSPQDVHKLLDVAEAAQAGWATPARAATWLRAQAAVAGDPLSGRTPPLPDLARVVRAIAAALARLPGKEQDDDK